MSGMELGARLGEVQAGRASTIAYELELAGDALAKQAENLRQQPAAGGGLQAPEQKRLEVAEALDAVSRHLHATAREIVRNLK